MKSIKINSIWLPICIALINVAVYNVPFWKEVVYRYNVTDPLVLASLFIAIAAACTVLFSITNFPYISKAFISLILVMNSGLLYFMNVYNVQIDKNTILSAVNTHSSEAMAWIHPMLVVYVFALGIIPILFLYKNVKVIYGDFAKTLLSNILVIVGSLLVVLLNLSFLYKHLVEIEKIHNVKYRFLPTSYLDTPRVLLNDYRSSAPLQTIDDIQKIGGLRRNKTITIFVLGEAARSKNFSLNGYERKTTPYLLEISPISFKNFYSCDTITKQCVPCLFSHLERKNFNRYTAVSHENLIDLVKKSGMEVLWRGNNGECEGVCTRVQQENLTSIDIPTPHDEKLLYKLENFVENNQNKDMFIVLHQKGSHGPDYSSQHPSDFKVFNPTCSRSKLFRSCTNAEIVNSYDNTILYTDYFLSEVVNFLKKQQNYNTAMIYVSDHGESLGEGGMYMHGTPYFIAPIEQKHIPFILWFSDSFKKEFRINEQCLRDNTEKEYSHDNIFHSVLGLFGIQTKFYNSSLDMFKECQSK